MPQASIRRSDGLVPEATSDLILPEEGLVVWHHDDEGLYVVDALGEPTNLPGDITTTVEISEELVQMLREHRRTSDYLEKSEELRRLIAPPQSG